ncbi:unnamed protein product [Brachionus calyciflorus]|uniref:Uncharacterized protein n=1 Tax=Brachionus calyciflorus TaxID=104777 RepID=A0A813LW84_9BILA|nr:unnamed protein product [Brachionus calyciflorus]
MLMLTDALKIAFQKVFLSIANIFLFRNIFTIIKYWLSGFYAFFVTIFITNKIRNWAFDLYTKVKFKLFPEWEKYEIKFDKSKIDSINLIENKDESEIIENFIKTNKETFQNDLFTYIFSSSSQSTVINLIAIIAIEYLNTNYFENIILSILTCVGVAFILCFGASFKYSSILTTEWSDIIQKISSSEIQKASHKSKKILFVYNRELDGRKFKDNVCLWWCNYDSHNKTVRVELKFLSAAYSNFVAEIISNFILVHILGQQNEGDNESSLLTSNNQTPSTSSNKNDKFDILVPDYYDQSFVVTNALRKLGFKKQDSWKEFKLFPMVDFKISSFTNFDSKKIKNKYYIKGIGNGHGNEASAVNVMSYSRFRLFFEIGLNCE